MSNMFLNVVSTFKGDGLTAATRQLGAFGQAAGGLGATLGKVGAALASFGIAAKAVSFTKETIDSARDLERNLFSVNTIFGTLAPRMVQFTKDAEKIGLSQKDAAKAVTFLGSVLKQSGFSMEETSNQTEKLVGLAVDLAATYGYDVSEALMGMTALFRGEYDPIEKFGVAMKQNEINLELVARGMDKLAPAQRRNAEQIIRMELLYQRAADASGAFAAQSGNLFVEQKKLSAVWENMQATVGTALLPAIGALVAELKPLVDIITPRLVQVVNDAVPALGTLTTFIRDMGDQSTTTGSTVTFLADTIGTFFRLISENLGLILQLTAVLAAGRVAVFLYSAALAATPFGAAVVGLTALAGSLVIAFDNFKKFRGELDKTSTSLTNAQKDTAALTVTLMELPPILGPIITLFQNLTKAVYNYVLQLKDIPSKIKTDVELNMPPIMDMGEAGAYQSASDQFKAGLLSGGTGPETPAGGTKKVTSPVVSGLQALQQTLKLEGKKATKQADLLGQGLSKGLVDQILTMPKPLKTANQVIAQTTKKNGEVSKKAVKQLNNQFSSQISEVNRVAAEVAAAAQRQAAEFARAQEEAARAEAAALAERERIYNSFLDSIKGTFASIKNTILGAFDIKGLGGSTNAIIRNMNKLLAKTRDFSTNISKLASMGLDPALLQQIIASGPIAGARLAGVLVGGGASALSQINAGYTEFGALASAIGTTGTTSLFGREAQTTVYNINVDGGIESRASIGKAIVEAIKAYERTSGAVWQGA